MKMRLSSDRIAQGLGVTEESIDAASDVELLGSSEATIVSIVEMYLAMKKTSESETFRYIEQLRAPAGRGNMPPAPTLRTYLRYRLSVEHSHGAPISEEILSSSVDEVRNFFKKQARATIEAEAAHRGAPTLEKLFGPKPSEEELEREDLLQILTPAIVKGYRRIAAERGCAPGTSISDADIIHIYCLVNKAFGRVAEARGEDLPWKFVNNIVLIFLQKYQMFGPTVFMSHLDYEAERYLTHGLRAEYARLLDLR